MFIKKRKQSLHPIMSEFASKIDEFFHITERGSTIRTEIKGGIITYLAMLYILVVNPAILSETGMDFNQLATATALASFISCALMALYAQFPVALAPGMGENAFLSYTIVSSMGFDYYQALMVVFISGVGFFFLAVSGLRKKLFEAIPPIVRISMAAGIGFFIMIIGMYNSGIIVHGTGSALTLGDLGAPGVFLGMFCILFTTFLWFRQRWDAILMGMTVTFVIGLLGGILLGWDTVTPDGSSLIPGVGTAAVESLVTMPDLSLVGSMITQFTFFDGTMIPAFLAAIASLIIVDTFDTTGTLFATGKAAGIMDDNGNVDGKDRAFKADAAATLLGAFVGTSTTTSYVESTTGIASGARTGLMPLVTGFMFLIAMFFAPLFAMVTGSCTVGALVIVGFLMLRSLKDLDLMDPISLVTVFTTVFMTGLSGSITDGIAFGVIAYMVSMVGANRISELSFVMKLLFTIFVLYFALIYLVIPMLV